jgi:hypothetical protein
MVAKTSQGHFPPSFLIRILKNWCKYKTGIFILPNIFYQRLKLKGVGGDQKGSDKPPNL